MNDFRHQAESAKLARLLHTTAEDLDFLAALDASELHVLRLLSTRYLLNEHQTLFRRIATASKLLPSALNAFISERALGALLCARIANEMSTRRAIEIARHLPVEFMAATALYLDTERATALTAALPMPRILAVAQLLIAQREFITLGALADALPFPVIERIIREIRDGEALLRIAFFIEDPERLNRLLDVLPTDRLQGVLQAAADENMDLWPYALALMSVVELPWQRRLVAMAAESNMQTLASMIRGVIRHDLWATVLPLVNLMTEAHRRHVINLLILQDDDVLRRLFRATETHDLWLLLLPLAPLMEPNLLKRMAMLADELSENTIRHLVQLAHEKSLWASLLPLVQAMGIVRRATIAGLVAESPDSTINSLIDVVREHDQWHFILPLIATMTEQAQRRLVSLPVFQEEAVLSDIISATDRHGLWSTMTLLVRLMPENEQRRVAHLYEAFDAAAVQRWSSSMENATQWQVALDLINYMHPVRRGAMAMQIAEQTDAVLNHLLRSLHETGHWAPFLSLLTELSTEAQHQLLARASTLEPDLRTMLLIAAEKAGKCDSILQRMAEMPAQEQALHRCIFLRLPENTLERLRMHSSEIGFAGLLDPQ